MIERLHRFFVGIGFVAIFGASTIASAEANGQFLAPVAVDQAGKLVGPLVNPDELSATSMAAVSLKPGEPPVAINVVQGGFYTTANTAVLYRHNTCTGEQFIEVALPLQADYSTYDIPDVIEYPNPTATPIFATRLWYKNGSNCHGGPGYLGVPASFARISALGFARSFRPSLVPATANGRPYVVDSKGQVVGPIYVEGSSYGRPDLYYNQDLKTQVVLSLKPDNIIVLVPVTDKGFGSIQERSYGVAIGDTPGVLYASHDCSGQGFIQVDKWLMPHAFLDSRYPQNIFFQGNISKDLHMRSFWSGTTCYDSDQGIRSVRPVRSAAIDTQGFTPPFTVVLR